MSRLIIASTVSMLFAAGPAASQTALPEQPAPGSSQAERIKLPNWLQRADAADILRYYPEKARLQRVQGRARVSCMVAADGSLASCEPTSESPAGFGFGQAAAELAVREFRMALLSLTNEPVPGRTVWIPITWSLEDEAAAPAGDRGSPDLRWTANDPSHARNRPR